MLSLLSLLGGHTTEIIRLMGALSPSYKPRHYVLADTDKMSEEKIRAFEAQREKTGSASQVIHLQCCSSAVMSYFDQQMAVDNFSCLIS